MHRFETSGGMLVLTRKKNESIMLGVDIKITILEINDESIKIGIDAPKELTVLRSEVYRKVEMENTMAVKVGRSDLEQLRQLKKEK